MQIKRELNVCTFPAVEDLVMPYFVVEGKSRKGSIPSFPGVFRFSVDNLLREIEEIKKLGIGSILLFGVVKDKDAIGSSGFSEDGIVQKAVRAIKSKFPDLLVITDVCLCGYTLHGHCGILANGKWQMANGKVRIDFKKTLEALAKIAVSHARAGADIVAPSAMAKGQVRAIRKALDDSGFGGVAIMGYSAKYASNFYGPFRDAAASAPAFGDRRGYQLDFTNGLKRALKEVKSDIEEGADVVMVKPALPYLDIIRAVKEKFKYPLAAYNVSGEYAMVKALSRCSVLGARCSTKTDNRKPITETEKGLVFEILAAIKRAGADVIITYHAKDVANWLNG